MTHAKAIQDAKSAPVATRFPVGTRVEWNTCPPGSFVGTVESHTRLKARVMWDHGLVTSQVYPLHLTRLAAPAQPPPRPEPGMSGET